jgi:hypothetical protein
MRAVTVAFLLGAAIATAAHAADKTKRPAAPPAAVAPAATSREATLEHLFAERQSLAALHAVIEQARKQDIGEQVILEARFLFLVDRHDDEAIAALLPEFIKRRAAFNLDDSKIFACKDDWLAVNEYVEAIAALQHGDKDGFKRHITEAFWLSPRQGAVFAPHIERLRLAEAMRSIKIDLAAQFATINSPTPESLKNLLAGHHALLLHFWSPWSNESAAAMPDFIVTAKVLETNKIAVASILAGDSAKVLADARAALKALGAKPPGAWLIDKSPQVLNRQLRVLALPTMVLVAADGGILFNGDPADDALWQALLLLNPAIRRPPLATSDSTP